MFVAWFTRLTIRPRRVMGSTAFSALAAQNGVADSQHTVTAMARWSILNKQLPAVEKIKAIHIYDFDNTRKKDPSEAQSCIFQGPCANHPTLDSFQDSSAEW